MLKQAQLEGALVGVVAEIKEIEKAGVIGDVLREIGQRQRQYL